VCLRAFPAEALLEQVIDAVSELAELPQLGPAGVSEASRQVKARPGERDQQAAVRVIAGKHVGGLGEEALKRSAASHELTLPALGCGSLAVAHQPNERIREADVDVGIDLTETLARAFADYVPADLSARA
jgi:acetylornithine deacetylase/succinyl-diaminopimelate desuccinylase-like protein